MKVLSKKNIGIMVLMGALFWGSNSFAQSPLEGFVYPGSKGNVFTVDIEIISLFQNEDIPFSKDDIELHLEDGPAWITNVEVGEGRMEGMNVFYDVKFDITSQAPERGSARVFFRIYPLYGDIVLDYDLIELIVNVRNKPEESASTDDEPQDQPPAAEPVILFAQSLERIKVIRDQAQAILTRAQDSKELIDDELKSFEKDYSTAYEKLIAAENEIEMTRARSAHLENIEATIQREVAAIKTFAEQAAAARSAVQSEALISCQAAERCKRENKKSKAESVLSEVRSHDAAVRSAQSNYKDHINKARSSLSIVDSYTNDARSQSSGAGTAQGQLAEAQSEVTALEGLLDAMMMRVSELKTTSIDALVSEAASIHEKARSARGGLANADKKNIKQIGKVNKQIQGISKDLEKLLNRIGNIMRKPRERLAQCKTKLYEINGQMGSLREGSLNPANVAKLSQTQADAMAAFDAAEIFASSVEQSVSQSETCLRAAEEHVSSLQPELSPDEICANSWEGAVFRGTYNNTGQPYCDCGPGLQWNDDANRTHCVKIPPKLSPNQMCNRDMPGSVDSGRRGNDGMIICTCPDGYEWNDPTLNDYCTVSKQDAMDRVDRDYCSTTYPGSVATPRDANGKYSCVCPTGTQWHDPINFDYCEQPRAGRQKSDREVCNTQFPGSVPGPKNAQGLYKCFCPDGYQWNNPNNVDYCVPMRSRGQGRDDALDGFIDAVSTITDAINQNNNRNRGSDNSNQGSSNQGWSNQGSTERNRPAQTWTNTGFPTGQGQQNQNTPTNTNTQWPTGSGSGSGTGCARASDAVLGQGSLTDDCLP